MWRDMSDLYEVSPPTYIRVISIDPLIDYDCKIYGHTKISQYKILNLFIATKYTQLSRNIIYNHTRMTQIMICV